MRTLKYLDISATNCNKGLIFGKLTFLLLLFPNNSSPPIISQIHLFVMSHFTTLSKDFFLLLHLMTSYDILLRPQSSLATLSRRIGEGARLGRFFGCFSSTLAVGKLQNACQYPLIILKVRTYHS